MIQIITIANQDHLVVPKVLSDAYLEAFEFRDENPKVYQELEEFVEMINAADRVNPVNRSPEDVIFTFQEDQAHQSLKNGKSHLSCR